MPEPLPPGALATSYYAYERGQWKQVEGAVVDEVTLCVHVNGEELATYQCSPVDQEAMALGFLRAEEFIEGLHDVEFIELSHSGTCVDVWLRRPVSMPKRSIQTSGCGGGVTFDDLTRQRPPLAMQIAVSPDQIIARYQEFATAQTLYPLTRGVHASALCTPDAILLLAEDVGRHNTLDKLWGKAMQQGIDTDGCLIMTTGRISSEMLGKAAKMGVPVIVSRTSPTSRSVALARAWNITVAGYFRRDGFRVYAAPERVLGVQAGGEPTALAQAADLK